MSFCVVTGQGNTWSAANLHKLPLIELEAEICQPFIQLDSGSSQSLFPIPLISLTDSSQIFYSNQRVLIKNLSLFPGSAGFND
jgi:hypothetical protein